MYNKCCVPGCVSVRQNSFLHKFPKCEKRLQKWLDRINCVSLRNKSVGELGFLQVCHKHFEARFVTKKSRLLSIAYPTLFLQSEILNGVPLNSHGTIENVLQITEHSYFRKRHFDHTYSLEPLKVAENEENLVPEPEDFTWEKPSAAVPVKADSENEENLVHEPEAFSWEKPSTAVPIKADAENEENLAPKPEVFSWEKQSVAVPVKADDEAELEDVPDNMSMYCDDGDTDAQTAEEYAKGVNERLHKGFRCNVCSGDIEGYRYTCVQCSDYDMCSACEASGAHDRHYVLRVPQPRPHSEVQSVLARIRRHLMKQQNPIQDAHDDDDRISIKSEVKEEELEQDVLGVDNLEVPHDPVEEYYTELEHNPLEMDSKTDVNWSPHKFCYSSETMNISNTSCEFFNMNDEEAQSSDAADVAAATIQESLSTTSNIMKRKLNIHQSDFNINTRNITTVSPDSNITIPLSTAKRRIIINNNNSMKSLINNILEKQIHPTPATSRQTELVKLDVNDVLRQMKCNV